MIFVILLTVMALFGVQYVRRRVAPSKKIYGYILLSAVYTAGLIIGHYYFTAS